ncbi:MAG: hypothetical protein K6E49_07480 [Lachnospiraceae bacterium]|nr:hypothetical protein [Lachnospiraceae bacterium]
MGINSYGLFSSGQPGGSYGDRNYELQRQLQARQQQLSDLERMPVLSAAQQEKRQQLLNAVDTLSGKLDTKPSTSVSKASPVQPGAKDTAAGLNSIGRRDTEDGIVIPKNKMDVTAAYSKMTGRTNRRPNPGYADNEYSNSDKITYKNPGRYDGSATTPGDTYLKGFFVDIKL